MSSRIMPTGSKLVSIFAWSLIAWNSFLTLSRSASRSTSRIASMNWPWNSAAMRRILPTAWPTVRMTRGRSFGGITAKATMPTMIILLMSRSNIAHRTRRPNSDAASATSSSPALRFENALSRPYERRSRDGRSRLHLLVVVGQALLERLHALGDVDHEVGNLALAAEQQERNRTEQHPMPNAKATHGRHPILRRPGSGRRRIHSLPANLSARRGKNKLA